MLNIQNVKKRLADEWIPAGEKERPEIANSICGDLAWELDLTRIPYNPTGDPNVDKEDWQWLAKSDCESLATRKDDEEDAKD